MLFPLLISTLVWFTQPQELTGTVTDNTGEALPGATVFIPELRTGTVTDANGNFTLTFTAETDEIRMTVSFIGHITRELVVSLPAAHALQVTLSPDLLQRETVLITSSPSGSNRSFRPSAALSMSDLQERSADNFGDALQFMPGLNVRSFGAAPSRPVIRGFDGDRVVVLENGERMGDLGETAPDHATSLDIEAAERIEIVRGPASFLYGSGAMGGVVNLLNNDIPSQWSRGASGRLSLTGMTVNDGGATFGRVTYGLDQTAFTARFSYRNTGDFRTPSGTLPDTFNESFNGAVGMAFRNDSFVGGFSLSGLEQTYGLPEEITDDDELIEIRLNRINLGGFGQFTHDGFFDQTQLRFNLSRYGHKEVEIEFEDDGSIDEDIEIDFRTLTFSGSVLFVRSEAQHRISGALGASSYMRMLNVGGDEGLTPDGRNLNLALFGYADIPLTQQLRLQTGLRGDYAFLDTFANSRFAQPENPTRSDFSLSGSAGLNFQQGGFEGGLQLARSFRSPSIEELFTDAAHIGAGAYEIGDPNLKNETGLGLDLFGSYATSRFGIEISTFYYHISNFIYYNPTGEIEPVSQLPIFVVLADNARYFGFEADAVLRPLRNLTLSSGLDYVRAQRLDDNSALPFIPPMRLRSRLSYDTAQWNLGAELIHAFEQDRVSEFEDPTEAYTLVNIFAGLRFDAGGRHLLTARVDNLFDESYRNHLSRVDGGAFRYPMPGRGFTLRYQYIF
ncbi:iron complex outermembrane recepter protein [Cyclonatronum proteinivorum]|uniref:Iron complex outermembrane recepter protein n=1 Tax=Cyclonatronum proteinivorum TaxID=1457365 RepID=A0A345UIA6_9BACT|nr:TonB-dependent receptor [Cyclonatronum proteinivorum]AXJ00208.1 iron complex outermembrane recepter protein [Cyclonatronum proteinivorum]